MLVDGLTDFIKKGPANFFVVVFTIIQNAVDNETLDSQYWLNWVDMTFHYSCMGHKLDTHNSTYFIYCRTCRREFTSASAMTKCTRTSVGVLCPSCHTHHPLNQVTRQSYQ